ncbi:MAG: sporulation protein [Oscillospiraceae bacterium]|nr:sporulation protein [Oscillospiraceae bacterium]
MDGQTLLARLAETFDLPGEAVAGEFRLEVTGGRELRMENHRGILNYSDTEIRISAGRSEVCVRGTDLTLRAMNDRELLITGLLLQIDFSGEEGAV